MARSHLSPVATCRQTVEAFLAPPSTAWQRMATGNDPKEKGLLLQTPLSRYPPKPNTIPITSVLATRATRKTTRFSVRDAKYNAAGAMHRVAWALQDSKAIGQICEKPWENLWFLSGEDRNRTFGCFPYVFEEFERYSDKIPRDRNSVQLTIKQRLSERWR